MGYQEGFLSGSVSEGAYVCHLTIATSKLTMAPGGPASYVSPAAGEHSSPQQAFMDPFLVPLLAPPPVIPPLVVPVAEDLAAVAARLALEGVVVAAAPVALILALILGTATPAGGPGIPQPHGLPADPNQLRLNTLAAKHAAGTLTLVEEDELITLLAKVKGIHVQRLSELEEKIPFGFPNSEDFTKAGDDLKAALKESGLKYKKIGVRGSSVTGLSSKGGSFRNEAQNGLQPSDVDVFIDLSEDVDLTDSKSIPGFIHPDKLAKRYPALKKWARTWTQKLGREITPGAFKPGTFTDQDIIVFK